MCFKREMGNGCRRVEGEELRLGSLKQSTAKEDVNGHLDYPENLIKVLLSFLAISGWTEQCIANWEARSRFIETRPSPS